MSKPVVIDITTSTTESSTALPSGFRIVSVKNMDAAIAISISFDETIATATYKATLAATDEIDFSKVGQLLDVSSVYWDAASGTPVLRVVGFKG